MNYITTNIRFPEDVYMQLKAEAAQKRKSLSAVVREKVSTKPQAKDKAQQLIRRLDATAAILGKALKGFDSVAAIRAMREER